MEPSPAVFHRRTRTLVLERIRKGVLLQTGPHFRAGMTLDVIAPELDSLLQCDIFGRLFADRVETSTEVPATWQDAVKDRFVRPLLEGQGRYAGRPWRWLARRGWVRRLAPQYRAIPTRVLQYRVCPHVDVPFDRCRGNLHLNFLEGSDYDPRTGWTWR